MYRPVTEKIGMKVHMLFGLAYLNEMSFQAIDFFYEVKSNSVHRPPRNTTESLYCYYYLGTSVRQVSIV